jgi:hypothetical protein
MGDLRPKISPRLSQWISRILKARIKSSHFLISFFWEAKKRDAEMLLLVGTSVFSE